MWRAEATAPDADRSRTFSGTGGPNLPIGNELGIQLGRAWQGRLSEATDFYDGVVSQGDQW